MNLTPPTLEQIEPMVPRNVPLVIRQRKGEAVTITLGGLRIDHLIAAEGGISIRYENYEDADGVTFGPAQPVVEMKFVKRAIELDLDIDLQEYVQHRVEKATSTAGARA